MISTAFAVVFFKQKTAYEMRISDWSSDVCSSDLAWVAGHSIERLPDGLPVWVIQLAMALLTTLFSLVISHVGATIVMVPLAINLALAVGGSPTAFALLVALSASNNFMTASNPSISMLTGPDRNSVVSGKGVSDRASPGCS